MASIQEPEVQFAQRLASNEKPIRTKAVKKLRKYINVRSQKDIGGFTGDELLKLWKGLFYCLWMQDKPQLQEELSNQISSLIHSFHSIDGQILYLESFLQTFKREWTGIDRLRMDKFFQLVRFMFRQTFEMLKRRNWESSVVGRFLELLTAQLLQSGSAAPCGLQLHILELYMTELAAVGSAELTADQNLIFMEPFCKTAAKTKDHTLFRAICSSIFSTIIDQAPFAIEDLMKEVKAAEDLDSDLGQASEEEDKDQLKERTSKLLNKKGSVKQINGCKSNEIKEDDDDLGHLEESPCDDDIGPVLQFDYGALADKLFQLASRSTTPSHNRQKLYKIITVLRDLSEGIFPNDEYPEEVSTDEDDDMFGSRKKMKRAGHMEDDKDAITAKKSKGKKKEVPTHSKQKQNLENDCEQSDLASKDENNKKKRKKKKKKARQTQSTGGEENVQRCEAVTQAVEKMEGGLASSLIDSLEKDAQPQSLSSSVQVTDAATSQTQKQPSVVVSKSFTTDNKDRTKASSKKNKDISESKPEATEMGEEPRTPTAAEASDATAPVPAKKKTLKQTAAETDIIPKCCEAAQTEMTTSTLAGKKKGPKAEREPEGSQCESQANGWSSGYFSSVDFEESAEGGAADVKTPAKKKRKKRSLKADEAHEVVVEGKHTDAEITCVQKTKGQRREKMEQDEVDTDPTPKDNRLEAAADKNTITPLKKKKENNRGLKTAGEEEQAVVETSQGGGDEKQMFEITMTTPAKKKKKAAKLATFHTSETKDDTQLQVDAEDYSDKVCFSKKAKKKRKIPVVFEFEADEEEAASKKSKLGNDAEELLSTKKSQKKTKPPSGSVSDFVTFQKNAAVPTPLFCKTKRSPGTPLSSKKVKKRQTPTSESKKVTFGLKNNKTAEFKKTDRSLLVSPDGSSRVPFDPKQKPKFGVLKSPLTPLRKKSSNTPKSTARQRPSAADFF